jgi:hypothetical protein
MNGREYRVIGMSRSGSHAVINWMLAQMRGRTCFANCAEPLWNPLQSARPLDDGRRIVVNYDGFNLDAELRGEFSGKDNLVFSHEDTFLGPVAGGMFEECHDAMVGPSRERTDVLILRDPYNLFASRIQSDIGTVSNTVAIRIWKQHAREFLGLRRRLNQRPVLVNYNRWCSERRYRRELARQLRLEFTDGRVHDVPRAGNGSSFDGRRFDGRAGRMRTHERWMHFANDPAYHALFDDDVQALAGQIFGDVGYPSQADAQAV